MTAPLSSVTLVIVPVTGIWGSSCVSGCAQGGFMSCSARAATLLWQLEHTVPGGVNTWKAGTIQLVVMGVASTVSRGGRLVGLLQLGQPPLATKAGVSCPA